MKNLMIYVSPTYSFDNPRADLTNDASVLVKVQIDNSLALGWKREDILLTTNFPYQYRGVKAIALEDTKFFDRKPQASKINAILNLFEKDFIENDTLYWFHDLDAYQLQPITEQEIGLGDDTEIAVTDYGVSNRWSTGVVYFKKDSKDIFEQIREVIYKRSINEELALGILTKYSKEIAARVKKLNKSYNFTPVKLRFTYPRALKPIRVAHFHTTGGSGRFEVQNPVAFFKGENELNIPLITEGLIKVFSDHGIK